MSKAAAGRKAPGAGLTARSLPGTCHVPRLRRSLPLRHRPHRAHLLALALVERSSQMKPPPSRASEIALAQIRGGRGVGEVRPRVESRKLK